MDRLAKKLKGFTLIEILAATTIFAGMMVVTAGIFSAAVSGNLSFTTKRLIHQSAQTSVEAMIREVGISKNIYQADGTIAQGDGAYVIFNRDGKQNSQPSLSVSDQSTGIDQLDNSSLNLKETVGNGLLVFPQDRSGLRTAKAYYLCPHPREVSNPPKFFSFGVKDLGITGDLANFENNWQQHGQSSIRANINCDSNWQQLTSDDVIISRDGDDGVGNVNPLTSDVVIRGFFPENGLTVQPRITISLTAKNYYSTKVEEAPTVTYRSTIVHRDYGSLNLP